MKCPDLNGDKDIAFSVGLLSLGGILPYEYSDQAGGMQSGRYAIRAGKCLFVPKK